MLASLLLAFFSATSAHSQEPVPVREPVQRIAPETLVALRKKLAADANSAELAWGAWETAEANARELVPDVVSALRRTLSARTDKSTSFVLRAELDALIRLDAKLTRDDVAAVLSVGSVRTQGLVLASREPALHADALAALRPDSRDEERLAVDQLLARGAPARIVALLMPETHVRIEVHVLDENTGFGRGGGSMTGIGCGSLKAPEHFPPTVIYSLRRGGAKDQVVFADGPQPIAYARVVHGEREFGVGGSVEGVDAAEHALALLRWITGEREGKSTLASVVDVSHTWRDRQTYINEVSVAIDARKKAWNALLDALVAKECLDAKARPAKPPIEVVVDDRRANQSVPLPPLGP